MILEVVPGMRIPCCFLLTLVAFGPGWLGRASSSDTNNSFMEVRSGRDLAIAFASSANVDVAIILADVWMLPTDWNGLLDESEPIVLKKNFTIMGSPSLPEWPLLNMGFVRDKIRIGNGVALIVQHVVVGDFRSSLLTQTPGFDLAARTFPGSVPGILLHNETAVMYSVCLPEQQWSLGMNSSQDATTRPGSRLFKLGIPQPGCMNITSQNPSPLLYPPSRGLALQPRLPARCWAARGVFVDFAVPGADPTVAGSTTVPNNYDVLLINVSYMCASVMTTACIRQYKGLLPCAISMVQNDTAPQPWRLPVNLAVEVRTGKELATALAAAPLVASIVIEQDVWMDMADWEGLLGGPNGSEPALISHNLSVLSNPQLASWPLVNLGYVHDKIRLTSNASLTAQHLLVADFRNEIPTQGPGLDLARATILNSYDTHPATIILTETALLYTVCFPVAAWNASLASSQRPASQPGAQGYQLSIPQPGCISVVPPAGLKSVGGVLQPPFLSRCWADRGIFHDVAFNGADVDQYEKQVPTMYDVVLLNVSYLCANTMTNECIREHGDIMGCSSWMRQQLMSQVLPWQQHVVPSPPAHETNEGGGSESRATRSAAIGGGLGGASFLLLLVVAVILFVRHRSRQLEGGGSKKAPDRDLVQGNGAVAADCGGAPDGEVAASRMPSSSGKKNPCLPLASARLRSASSSAVAAPGVIVTTAPIDTVATAKSAPAAAAGVAGGRAADGCGSASASGSGEEISGETDAAGPASRGRGSSGVAGGIDAAAAAVAAAAAKTTDGDGGGGSDDVARPAPIPSTPDPTGDPSTRSGDPDSSSSMPGPPQPQNSTAILHPEDEHVVVTPLTPHRSDLTLGEAAAQEVMLLPVVRGKGAFGRVYEGMYGGERVAVKVMRDLGDLGAGGGGSLEHIRNSFAQEVEVLGRCRHPNVVRLLAACLTPPKLLLVMELMESSLEKLVYNKNDELLPLRTVLYISLDISKGLEYLHPTILHRDLKPGNVLINGANSPRPIAKLTDFGVSRLRSTVLITKHPEAGTPAYMAPETFDVRNYTLTHHVDMYSFGVLLWVLLTGEHPWKGFQMVEVAYKVTINEERLPISRIPASRCPIRLRALMEQCWEHEPRRRPAAAEAVKEIQGLIDAMGF
ncbi:hypothetical protein VaNZ11_009920 [Volvox africanus]|uniref:Protein kinase domain-containing protein n=1 Tax=Volvox africanus TaxID=51714 RepID=A0ABQ5S8C5_9CHLO|nr:hypothetical protein VaNZ11_009920 [Volvox africanus]